MNKNVLKTVQMAMFAAISVVLVYIVRFPLIPTAPFLEYDMADVPIILCTLLLGTGSGLTVLIAACAVQAMTVSAASGWIGFVMHLCATAVLVLTVSLIFKKSGRKTSGLVVGLIAGAVAMTLVMIPLNLVFTGIFMGTGTDVVAKMLVPAIIPFNLAKAGINCVLSGVLFFPIKMIFDRVYKQK